MAVGFLTNIRAAIIPTSYRRHIGKAISVWLNAAVITLASLEWTVTIQANLKKVNYSEKIYFVLTFVLAMPCILARLAWYWASIPET